MKSCHSSHFSEMYNPTLPNEVILEIFDHLDFTGLYNWVEVNKKWNDVSIEKINKILSSVFSPKDWNAHFENHLIPKEDMKNAFRLLPLNIDKIPCPIYEGKKMIDTHVITYIPKNLTINKYEMLLKEKLGTPSGYTYIWDQVVKQFGNDEVTPGWRAMTREALPNSIGKTFFIQKNQVDCLNRTPVEVFKIPSVLEVLVCISTEFFKTGKKIYQTSETRCQENILKYQVTVGYSRKGLIVNHYSIHRLALPPFITIKLKR